MTTKKLMLHSFPVEICISPYVVKLTLIHAFASLPIPFPLPHAMPCNMKAFSFRL